MVPKTVKSEQDEIMQRMLSQQKPPPRTIKGEHAQQFWQQLSNTGWTP
jgi:hypothetical protein